MYRHLNFVIRCTTRMYQSKEQSNRVCWICYSDDPFSSYYRERLESTDQWWRNLFSSQNDNTWPRATMRQRSGPGGDEWVQPCPCKGSMRWVHQSCLLAWTRVQFSNIQSNSFTPVMLNGQFDRNWWERILGTIIPSRNQVAYYVNEQLCCPQCKTSYRFQEIPTGLVLASLETIELLASKALVFISASGVALSIYTLMWVYGYFALRCLVGADEMHQLIIPLHHHIPYLVGEGPYHPGDWTRQAMFVCIAIPTFPMSLLVSSNPAFSRWSPFLLHYFAHLYYPNTSNSDFEYLITTWFIPLTWYLYKFSRKITPSGADPVPNDIHHVEADETRQESDETSDTNSDASEPSTAENVTASIEPSAVRINLLSITQILCWPFAAAVGGKILLILASKLANMLGSGTINGTKMHINTISALDWMVYVSPMTRNAIVGFSLIIVKDIVSSVLGYYKERKIRSRTILPYHMDN